MKFPVLYRQDAPDWTVIDKQPLDLYYNKNATIPDKYPQSEDITGFEADQRLAFSTFIGTEVQVSAEKAAMRDRLAYELLRLRAAWTEKLDVQVEAYWEAAFAEQSDLHPEIAAFLHGRAYERGHSAGQTEVYSYFRDYCNEYRDLKALEKKLGF